MSGQKPDERDRELGQRMIEHRRRAKLTQRDVAAKFEMSPAQLQKYEKGTNRISAIHLAILSRLTGVPLAQFFEGIPRIDDVKPEGFAEAAQEALEQSSPYAGLALAMVRHIHANFDERNRREILAAVDFVSRELTEEPAEKANSAVR